MASFNTQGFDITPLVEQYRGKKLEDLYRDNHKVVKNGMGEFMELFWQEDNIPCDLKLYHTKKKLIL